MKTISLLNIKGGVGKTTSTIALAQLLVLEHGKRVLVIDADQQANTTQALYGGEAELTTADLLLSREPIAEKAIIQTEYGIDLIPSGFELMTANKSVIFDTTRPQQFRFKKQLGEIEKKYDYCIIDCPPDISMTVINALAVTDDVLVPIRADRYGFDGLSYVMNAVNEVSEYNPSLKLAGCFLTMYQTGTILSAFSKKTLEDIGLKTMDTCIRQCVKVGQSTFDKPLLTSYPNCAAAEDYKKLLDEYLSIYGESQK